jgi:hypothetical protein
MTPLILPNAWPLRKVKTKLGLRVNEDSANIITGAEPLIARLLLQTHNLILRLPEWYALHAAGIN